MRWNAYLMLIASGIGMLCFSREREDKWPVRNQETIQRTLELSGSPMRLVIDNVDGYVHVTGSKGSQVEVVGHKTIRAETDSDLQEAKSEVKLDLTERPGSVSVYYDAPWRCKGEGRAGCSDHQQRFYRVTYDLDVKVPFEARTVVSTVNDGDVRLDRLDGDFDVKNVNGAVSITGASASGDAHTVNGPVLVRFAKNPASASSFKTVNGDVDVYFAQDLSADLAFKTLNGQIYSDFQVMPRPIQSAETKRVEGKFVYHSGRGGSGRAGRGGPELSFDTLNGDIRLHREQ